MQTSRVRAVLLAVAVGAIVIGLLWMVTKISQGAVYIGNMPVYVKFPAEAPPAELIRGLGNKPITSVNRVIRYALAGREDIFGSLHVRHTPDRLGKNQRRAAVLD